MPPISADREPSALVEREAELAALGALVDAVLHGAGGTARVLGPAGVGKTSTLRAVVADAVSRGVQTWFASTGQLESRIPFGVVRRLLDRAVRELPEDQRTALRDGPGRLALTQLWADGHVVRTDEVPAQGDMMHSLGWLLEDLAANGPKLLVVDDAQWADEESLLFLGSLRERLLDRPVGVVIAARDEASDRTPALAALVADRDALVLRLAPLSGAGVDNVLAGAWQAVPPGTAAAVLEVTGGNPFLVRALADAFPDADADRVRAVVPDSVIDLMLARLAGLDSEEQALAHAVAVLDEASLTAAASVAGLEPQRAAAAADHLRRAGLFAEDALLTYRHALLRSAVYHVIGPDTRDLLHRASARVLAGATQAERSRVAAHLLATTGSGDGWACDQLRAASADAIARGAPQSAVALLQRAVSEPPADEELADVLFELGQAQLRTFDPGCLATLSRALDLTTDPRQRAARALVLASASAFAGLHAEAAAVLSAALDAVHGQDRELELTLQAAWAAVALLLPDRAEEARRRLETLGELDGETTAERLVLIQQLYVAASTNQPAETIRELGAKVIGDWDSPEQYPETGDWVWPRLFLGRIGDYDAVRRLADAGSAHAAAQGSVMGMIAASFVRAFTELDAGAFGDAEEYYRSMVEHHDGGLLIQILGHSGLAQALSRQGRHEEAHAILEQFPTPMPPGTPATGAALVWEARAVARHALGDHTGAIEASEQLRDLLDGIGADAPTWVSWRPLAIGPMRALGRLDQAHALAVEYLALCEHSGVPHLVGEALCLLGTTTTDPATGTEQLRRGVEILTGTQSHWRAGTGSLALGSMLRRAGKKVEAREHLQRAVTLLDGCGAASDRDFAASELAATGIRLVRNNPRQLTPSEHRVALLAAEGLSNREIATRLHVTRKTVETHLAAVFRKRDITRRDQIRTQDL